MIEYQYFRGEQRGRVCPKVIEVVRRNLAMPQSQGKNVFLRRSDFSETTIIKSPLNIFRYWVGQK